ncbi:MAG: hypothetical protein BWY08_01017 [Bacteroidetes bacterium ADurb.Bin174]|nr:MAG: hypothetical protein BWY08_01017 [Bacteroidetes bacterium ADurb.Bin174]
MKKRILYWMLTIAVGLTAQRYVPFPTENAQWNVFYASQRDFSPMDTTLLQYSLQGDTIINGKTYSKFCQNIGTIDNPMYKGIGGIREQDRRIYYWGPGYTTNYNTQSYDFEYLLYDFSKQLGDTVWISEHLKYVIAGIDSVKIGDEYRRRYQIPGPFLTARDSFDYIIEGIGSVKEGLLGSITDVTTCIGCNQEWRFVCFSRDGETVYKNPEFKNCNSTDKSDPIIDGVNNPVKVPSITVSPNPITKCGTIKWDTSDYDLHSVIVITDMLGKCVKTINPQGKTEELISNTDMRPGIYFIHPLTTNNRNCTVKMILQ